MQPFRADPDGEKMLFELLNSFGGVGISFQEMTLTGKSASHEHAVYTSLKGPQHINLIELSCTGKPDHFHAWGI